jgi:hypothetical protein
MPRSRFLSLSLAILAASSGATAVSSQIGHRDLLVGDSVKQACDQLHNAYPELLYLPNTTEYTYEITNVWDKKRSNLIPACVFRPTIADQVAKAISTFSTLGAQFAVRGGGHMNVSTQAQPIKSQLTRSY